MRRDLDAAIREQVKTQVMDQLMANHDVQLPEALVHQRIHDLKDTMQQQMQRQMQQKIKGKERQSASLPDELFREAAERDVAVGLISRKIVEKHELTADPDKIRERIEVLAEPFAEKEQVVGWYYQNDEALAKVESDVLEDSVVEAVLAAAEVSLQETPYAEIIAGKAPADEEKADESAAETSTPPETSNSDAS